MKKIFTFVMLSMVAMTMLAAPTTSLPLLSQAGGRSLQVASEKVQAITKRDANKYAHRPMQAEEAEAMTSYLRPLRKTEAKQDTIVLNAEGFLVGPEYEAEAGEWYIALEAQGYTFRLCWEAPANNYCGSFTMDDIVTEWTWGWYQSAGTFFEFKLSDVEMTISKTSKGKYLTEIVLDATITDTEDRVYLLHAVHEVYTAKSVVESNIENAQMTVTPGNFVLTGANEDLDVKLTVNFTELVDGDYLHQDLNKKGTKIVYKGVEQELLQSSLMVRSGNLKDGAMGYLSEFSFYSQDTILHKVSISAGLPTPNDTIRVSCTNLMVYDQMADQKMIILSGSSAEYDVLALFEAEAAEAGVYHNVYVTISDLVTWMPVEAIRADLTLKEGVNGWEAQLDVYCNDYNYYVIDMKLVVPVPTDTVKITFNESAMASYQPYNQNMLQLLNYGNDYEAAITIYDVALSDSFSMKNVYLDYCGVNKPEDEYSVEVAEITGTLNQYGDTTVIHANVIGFDSVLYDVTLWYAVPEPIDTVELEMPIEFFNSMEAGYYTLAAFTPDSAWYISLSPVTQEVAGTYVNDGLFGKFGAEGGQYDFYGGNSFVRAKDGEVLHTMEKGTLEVKLAADSTIFAEAKFICTNKIYYHLTMVSAYNEHLEYDEPYEEIDRTYTTADNVQIENKIEDGGYVYLCLTAADNTDQAAFFFFAEEEDPDIIIPVGVYPIDDTQNYGTVMANPGVDGAVWPSFYAQLADDGYLATPLWLLVEGNVEVSKTESGDVYMEVNARNSYGVEVHIVYDGSTTGMTDVVAPAAQATKYLKNGQLIIHKNSVEYNAQGAVIK